LTPPSVIRAELPRSISESSCFGFWGPGYEAWRKETLETTGKGALPVVFDPASLFVSGRFATPCR
jgi:hypothetical protein